MPAFDTGMFVMKSGEDPFAAPCESSTGYIGLTSYKKVTGDPEGGGSDAYTYELSTKPTFGKSKMLARFSTARTRLVNAEMDVTYEHLPYAMVLHAATGIPYLSQQALVKGTYKGQAVEFFGRWNRIIGVTAATNAFFNDPLVFATFAGRGEDGRIEYGEIFMWSDKTYGFFHRDGEAPVVANKVEADLHWEKDPDNANKVVVTEATIRFAGKEIYMKSTNGFAMGGLKNCETGKSTGMYFNIYNALAMNVLHVADTLAVWREKGSPDKFNLSYAVIESHATPKDVDVR